MKKIFVTLTILMLIMMAYSCSKDHEAPTFSMYSSVEKPTNVQASYSQNANAFTVTWDMANTTNVIDYYVAVADSENFNGINFEQPVDSTTKTFTLVADFMPAEEDSVMRYFAVHAVYDTEEIKTFIGPRSDDVAGALFIR